MNSALFSHNTDNWRTPSDLYNFFINCEGCFDPFPYMSTEDNFNKIYHTRLFLNPPFSRLKDIPGFISRNLVTCHIIYLLMPARTDTKYFHELLKFSPKIYFIRGRLKFNDCSKGAPFPTILLRFSTCSDLPCYDFGYIFDLCR